MNQTLALDCAWMPGHIQQQYHAHFLHHFLHIQMPRWYLGSPHFLQTQDKTLELANSPKSSELLAAKTMSQNVLVFCICKFTEVLKQIHFFSRTNKWHLVLPVINWCIVCTKGTDLVDWKSIAFSNCYYLLEYGCIRFVRVISQSI